MASVSNDDLMRALASLAADGDLLNLEAAASEDAPPRDLAPVLLDVLRGLIARRVDFDATQHGFASRPAPLRAADTLTPIKGGWRVLNRSASVFSIAHGGASHECLPGGIAYLPADWSGDLPENAPTETMAYRPGIKVPPCTYSTNALGNRVRMLAAKFNKAPTPEAAIVFARAMLATCEGMPESPERHQAEPQARAMLDLATSRSASLKADAAAAHDGVGAAPINAFEKRSRAAKAAKAAE